MLLIFPSGVLQGIYTMRHLYHACYIQYVENVFGWSKYICRQRMFATGVKMVDGNGGFCLKAVGYGLAPIQSTYCFSPQTAGLHFLNFSRLPKMTREDFCASPWNLPRKLSLGSAFMSEMILTASIWFNKPMVRASFNKCAMANLHRVEWGDVTPLKYSIGKINSNKWRKSK